MLPPPPSPPRKCRRCCRASASARRCRHRIKWWHHKEGQEDESVSEQCGCAAHCPGNSCRRSPGRIAAAMLLPLPCCHTACRHRPATTALSPPPFWLGCRCRHAATNSCREAATVAVPPPRCCHRRICFYRCHCRRCHAIRLPTPDATGDAAALAALLPPLPYCCQSNRHRRATAAVAVLPPPKPRCSHIHCLAAKTATAAALTTPPPPRFCCRRAAAKQPTPPPLSNYFFLAFPSPAPLWCRRACANPAALPLTPWLRR